MIRSLSRLFIFALAATILGGCAAHWPDTGQKLQGPQAQFNLPPKQVVEKVKQMATNPPLAIGVQEDQGKGIILTGFQSFPGDWHVARRWQERTQYRVQVVPDWDDPANKCVVFVSESTEQRAADGMKWAPAADIVRPERAQQFVDEIKKQLGGS